MFPCCPWRAFEAKHQDFPVQLVDDYNRRSAYLPWPMNGGALPASSTRTFAIAVAWTIFFIIGIDNSVSFFNWLERRDPALYPPDQNPKSADDYVSSLTHPVVVRRVQKDMEAEAERLREQFGLKKDRPKQKQGL